MPASNVSEEIRHLINDKGYSQDRAVAAALSMQREGKISKADTEEVIRMIKSMFVKACEYPHLAKGGDGCPYAKSCGCQATKKAVGGFASGEAISDQGVRKGEDLSSLDLVKGSWSKMDGGTPDSPKGWGKITGNTAGAKASGGEKPSGGGWQSIPGGKKGGFRKRQGKGYVYWYPEGSSRPGAKAPIASSIAQQYREELKEYNLEVVAGEDGKLQPGDIERAADIAKKVKAGIEASADVCKLSPPVCAGNMGIPRDQMPQLTETPIKEMLKSSDPGEVEKAKAAIAVGADPNSDQSIMDQFLGKLRSQGVTIKKEKIPVGQLKATQKEIKAGKTYGMADAFLKGKFRPQDAEILVSSDGYILDGHHRYAALITAAPDIKMNVRRVDMPMRKFLEESFKQPGVFRADLQGKIVDPKTPHDLSGSSTQKSLMAWAQAHPEEARRIIRKSRGQGTLQMGAVTYHQVIDHGDPLGDHPAHRSLLKAEEPALIDFGVPEPVDLDSLTRVDGVLIHPNGYDRRN